MIRSKVSFLSLFSVASRQKLSAGRYVKCTPFRIGSGNRDLKLLLDVRSTKNLLVADLRHTTLFKSEFHFPALKKRPDN